MTTILLADLHLTDNPRDTYRFKTLRQIVRSLEKSAPLQTFILGDLTEAKDRHSSRLVNKVVDHIRLFATLGAVYVLKGNHDYSTSPDHPFFQFLTHIPDVHWINKPVVHNHYDHHELGEVLWLPHTRNWKRDWEGVKLDKARLVFAHQTFLGADMGNYIARDGVPTKIFHPDVKIFSGDVHVPQTFKRSGTPTGLGAPYGITYVGAPYTIDFGDAYAPRLVIRKNDKWLSVPIPGPQKRLVEYAPKGDSVSIIKSNALRDQLRMLSKGDILKVRVRLQRNEVERWPTIRDHMREWAAKNEFVLHAVLPVVEDKAGATMKMRKVEAKSDEDILREFARHRKLDEGMLKQGEKYL